MKNKLMFKKLVQYIDNCQEYQSVQDIRNSLQYSRVFQGIMGDSYFGVIPNTGGHAVSIDEEAYNTVASLDEAITRAFERLGR